MRQYFNFSKVLSHLKRKHYSNEMLIVCPICLRNSIEKRLNPLLGVIAPSVYICHHCNYKGPIFAEITLDEYKKINFYEFDYCTDESPIEGHKDIA